MQHTAPPRTAPTPTPPGDARSSSGTATATADGTGNRRTGPASGAAPVPSHRRDGIIPAIAAALSVRGGATLTCTGSKADEPPPHHPLVQDCLEGLDTQQRERHTGRCPEAVLLSRFLTSTEEARAAKRLARRPAALQQKNPKPPKPLTYSEAKRALKQAKLTARHIREDGDPLHSSYAPPCRSCTVLLAHFGITAVGHPPQEGR